MSDAVEQKNVAVWPFFVMACGLSWGFTYLYAANPLGLSEDGTTALNYAAKFGPSIAGILAVAIAYGRTGLGDLMSRVLQWRVHPGWYVFAFAYPIIIWAVCVALWVRDQENPPTVEFMAGFSFIGYFLARFFAGGGLGEELGWRGFMLPVLQDRWGPIRASLVVGLAWGVWHYPAFFSDPEKMSDPAAIGIQMALFTVYCVVLSFVYTYLFNGTGGSVLLCVIMHATMNGIDSTFDQMVPGQEADKLAALVYLVSLVAIVPLTFRAHRKRRADPQSA